MIKQDVDMQWLMNDDIRRSAGLSLAKMTVQPGVVSEAHKHPNCTETIHILEGTVDQRIGDQWVTLTAGDTVLIEAGVVHQTHAKSSASAVIMVAYSAGSRVYERSR